MAMTAAESGEATYDQDMLTGRTGLSPVMVGRSTELSRLTSLVRKGEAPTVALISGEAGIGKTRLVQELIAESRNETVVLAGQADSGSVSQPFELALDLFKGLRTASDAVTAPPAVPEEGGQSSESQINSLAELIRDLVGDAAGIVIFEDLHWSDPESLRVLEQLTEPSDTSLTVIGSFRPDGLSRRHPASALLPRLERRHRVHRVHLSRLSPADVGAFLNHTYGRIPSFRVVQAVHSRTGGNPFFVEELIAAAGPEHIDDLESLPLPWTVAELVRNQVDDLEDPELRRLLACAAVLGRRVSFDVLAAVTKTTEDQLLSLLHAAVATGLLVETEPDYFGFRHELAREAIEGGLLGRKRRRIHETALAALRAADSRDHATLAHHARGAGHHDELVEHARLGAHEALRRGASYQALQLAEIGLTEADDDLDLLAVATEAAWLANLLDDAVEHADRRLDLARAADDVAQEADALRLRIRVAWEAYDLTTMGDLTDALIATLDRLPTEPSRAAAMAFVAQSCMLRFRVDQACEWADKAQTLADASGLDAIRLAAAVEKGSALLNVRGRKAEACEMLESAAAEAARLGEHVLVTRALGNLLWNAPLWHDPPRVHRVTDQMREHAKAAGWLGYESDLALAYLTAVQGDYDRAAHLYDLRRGSPDGSAAQAKSGVVHKLRAILALEVGDLTTAQDLIDDAKQHTGGGARWRGTLHGIDVRLACHLGNRDQARAALRDQAVAIEQRGFAAPSFVHDILATALPTGILTAEELRPLVATAGRWIGHRLDTHDPWRQLLDAQLAEADGDPATAAPLYAAAATALEGEIDVMAMHLGSAHVGAARCLIALRRDQEARPHVDAAGTHLARWRGRRVEELDAVRRRLEGKAPTGVAGDLTPREREVAELIADGLTNSGLADHLYISPRTAAVHVSNILSKLGMSSRTEVAAWVAQGGLTD